MNCIQPEKTTHLVILLDCSGSMASVREATVRGYNEQVQSAHRQAVVGGIAEQTFCTLILFSDFVTTAAFVDPISRLKELREDAYRPRGGTSMLDAVGTTLVRMSRAISDSEDTGYMVVIISDGEENASVEFTYPEVAAMIKERQATGRWNFRYMGANQDLSKMEERLALPQHSSRSFVSSSAGVSSSFAHLSSDVSDYIQSRSVSVQNAPDSSANDKLQDIFDDDDLSSKRVLH